MRIEEKMSFTSKCKYQGVRLYTMLCRKLFGMKEQVFFISFKGKSYSDSPRAISEKLHEVAPELPLVWGFNQCDKHKGKIPAYIKCIDISKQLTLYRALAVSKCVVVNDSMYLYAKDPNQMIIQTWHGDRGFKKILLDATRKYVAEEIEGYCDLVLSGSGYMDRVIRTAMGYQGEILSVGLPRNDILMDRSDAAVKRSNAVKVNIGIPEQVRVLTYAPTFRDRLNKNGIQQTISGINIADTLRALEDRDHCTWYCLVRAHPGNKQGLAGVEYGEKIIDVSQYEDMADILLISDMLITDYSSSAGDFILKNKSVVLFHDDVEQYKKESRDFYCIPEETHFRIAHSQQELNQLIALETEEDVRRNCDSILAFYQGSDTDDASGHVARRIVQHLQRVSK